MSEIGSINAMNILRLKRIAGSVFVALSLFVSTFAAPLCACLEMPAATISPEQHSCCPDDAVDHCPMKSKSDSTEASLYGGSSHQGCECAAHAPQNPTNRKFEQQTVQADLAQPEIIFPVPSVEMIVNTKTPVFVQRIFYSDTSLTQLPARAPPYL